MCVCVHTKLHLQTTALNAASEHVHYIFPHSLTTPLRTYFLTSIFPLSHHPHLHPPSPPFLPYMYLTSTFSHLHLPSPPPSLTSTFSHLHLPSPPPFLTSTFPHLHPPSPPFLPYMYLTSTFSHLHLPSPPPSLPHLHPPSPPFLPHLKPHFNSYGYHHAIYLSQKQLHCHNF